MSEESVTVSTSTDAAQVAESISLPTTSDGKPNFGSRFGKSKQSVPKDGKSDSFLKEETELTGKSKKAVAKPIGQPAEKAKVEAKESTGSSITPVQDVLPLESKEPTKEEVKPSEIRKYKVKVNGEEREVTEDVLIRDYQIREASDKRFRDAAEKEKINQALESKLRMPDGSPNLAGIAEFLRAKGFDPDSIAENALAARLEYELLSPDQKRIRELEMKANGYEQQVKQIQAVKKHQAEQEIAQRHANNLQKSVMSTLDMPGNEDLPKTAETIRLIAKHMRVLTAQGIECEAKDVIDLVRDEMSQSTRVAVGKMTPDQLLKFLGKEKMDEFRKWELSQIKNPVQAPREQIETPVRTQGQKKHFKTMDDWKAYQRRDGIR